MNIHIYTQYTYIMVPSFITVSPSHYYRRAVFSFTYLINKSSDLDSQNAFTSTNEPMPTIPRYSWNIHRHWAMTFTVTSHEINSEETISYDTETFDSQQATLHSHYHHHLPFSSLTTHYIHKWILPMTFLERLYMPSLRR